MDGNPKNQWSMYHSSRTYPRGYEELSLLFFLCEETFLFGNSKKKSRKDILMKGYFARLLSTQHVVSTGFSMRDLRLCVGGEVMNYRFQGLP
jgi:hypothetical protein